MRTLVLRTAILFALLLMLPACAFMGYTAKDVSFTDRPVAKLIHHEGTVLIKTQGKWGVLPEMGMPLYSEDKVVTFNGAATIEFYDAARVGICDNSDVQITQRLQGWVPFRTIRELDRGILLTMGKIYFRTGKEKVQTHFITPAMVITFYYGKGNISIDADQQTYLLLEKGMSTFKVGEYKYGTADLPTDVRADSSTLLQSALSADVAASQAKLAREEQAAGRMTPAQADWYAAQAMEASAEEALANHELLKLYNPERVVYNWARKALREDKKTIELAREEKEKAIAEGAVAPGMEQPAEEAPAGPAMEEEATTPREDMEEQPLPEAPAPVAPSYSEPVAPSYSAPVAPSYQTPVAPSYVTPEAEQPAPGGPQAEEGEAEESPAPAPEAEAR